MAAIIRKILSLWHRKKALTDRSSITGRNHTFPVPYLAKLEGDRLQPGQSLILRGVITGKESFVINLTNGSRVEFDEETTELDDRLLCIRVDIEKKKIFLNACINNEWGKEGVIKHKWKVGDEFDIRIRSHDEEFEIFIDHKLAARFAHYLPIEQITHIFVTGAIELFTSEWAGTYYSTPYAGDIPGNLFPRRKFFISGLVKKKAKQFFIDFLNGQGDITLRIDIRFPAKKIICNSRINDAWGQEQVIKPFAFRRAKAFDMLIYVDEGKFVIYNDDCLIGSYEHRVDPKTCEKIQINGDVVLQGVHLK